MSLPAVVPLEMTDRIQEWSLEGRRHWQLSPRLALEAGPVVSYFNSAAELRTSIFGLAPPSGPPRRFYSRIATYETTDLRLGAAAELEFASSPRWSAQVAYRLATAPSRKLHLGSLAVGRRF